MMEENQGKPCHDSSDSKPPDFGDYMSTASTISSANSDNEEQEDIVKDSGANSKVFRDFSDSEYDSESEDICKTNFSQIPDKNSRRLEHYNTTIRSGVVASEKDFKSELVKRLEEDLRCDTNLEPDFKKQKNEELLNEKGKVTSVLIDMKAELEQEKQRSAKKLQEKDQDLTESFKLFDDLKNESLKKYKQYVEILQEKDQALAEASKQFINMKADGVASEKDFKSELVKRLEEDLRLQMKHNAALQSKLTEQTSLAKELAKENLQLNEELLEFRRVNCTLSKPKVEVNSLNESDDEVLDLEGVNQRNLELLYEKGKAISELIDMKADLEQEKLKNAKFLQEKDQAFTVALKNFIDMKNKNSDLKNESLKWRRKNLETEEILQEKDQALTKAFQNFIDMKAESLELDREKVQNTEIEDMKQLIEVEILMSENLKLTQEITFLNTNAQVNDLELKRMRTELEKGGSKEQEMVKLLHQKDEAITKTNSELVEEKQQNAEILKVKELALNEASKQLIDMKAQVTVHVQEIVRNVLEINNLKEELANER